VEGSVGWDIEGVLERLEGERRGVFVELLFESLQVWEVKVGELDGGKVAQL
jgi:hypothetical protein